MLCQRAFADITENGCGLQHLIYVGFPAGEKLMSQSDNAISKLNPSQLEPYTPFRQFSTLFL